jgi:hypothetical protein
MFLFINCNNGEWCFLDHVTKRFSTFNLKSRWDSVCFGATKDHRRTTQKHVSGSSIDFYYVIWLSYTTARLLETITKRLVFHVCGHTCVWDLSRAELQAVG